MIKVFIILLAIFEVFIGLSMAQANRFNRKNRDHDHDHDCDPDPPYDPCCDPYSNVQCLLPCNYTVPTTASALKL